MKFNKKILIVAILVLAGSAGLLAYQNKETLFDNESGESVATATATPTASPIAEISATPEITGNAAIDNTNTTVNSIIQEATSVINSSIETDSSLFNQETQIVNSYDEKVSQNQSL